MAQNLNGFLTSGNVIAKCRQASSQRMFKYKAWPGLVWSGLVI